MNKESVETKKKIWEQLGVGIEIVPIVIGLIIVIGTIYINAYYYYGYKFRVATYLEISEILLLSFVDLGQFSETLLIASFILLFLKFFYFIEKLRGSKNKALFNELVTCVSIVMILNEILFRGNKFSSIIFIVSVSTLTLFILPRFNIKITAFTAVISVILFVFLETGLMNHESVNKNHYSFGTSLITEKDTLVSDSSYYYVGKTRNYVFWYNSKDSAMTVIPMNGIKKIIIHNSRPVKKHGTIPVEKQVKKVSLTTADTTKKLQKK